MFINESQLEPVGVTAKMKRQWKSIGSWSLFSAIMGLIFSGLMLLYSLVTIVASVMLFSSETFSRQMRSSGWSFLIYMGIVVAVMISLSVFLLISQVSHLRFSQRLKSALQRESQEDFNLAWVNFRRHIRLSLLLIVACLLVFLAFYLLLQNLVNANRY